MKVLPRLGFIGVGAIAEALITGMCAGGEHVCHCSSRVSACAQRPAQPILPRHVIGDSEDLVRELQLHQLELEMQHVCKHARRSLPPST